MLKMNSRAWQAAKNFSLLRSPAEPSQPKPDSDAGQTMPPAHVRAPEREPFAFLRVLGVLRGGDLIFSGINRQLDHHLAANRLPILASGVKRRIAKDL